MEYMWNKIVNFFEKVGGALFFLGDVFLHIITGRIRWREVFKQIYQQGVQSIVILQ